MAEQEVVGLLRTVLELDRSDLAKGFKLAGADADAFSKKVQDAMRDADKSLSRGEQAVKRYEAAMRGDKLIMAANNMVAAMNRIGGATKLTDAEQARYNATLQKAVEKYKALGQEAPKAMLELERATRKTEAATSSLQSMARTAVGTFAGFMGAQAAMSAVRRSLGFVSDAVIGMNSSLETSELQFRTLIGNADQAKTHVRSLFDFAAKTPFLSDQVIQASRMMRTFGGAVLDTRANLQLLGDASAATSAPFEELGFWVGRLYSSIAAGKPFGEAAMRLQELAVLSPQARAEMERLQKAGANGSKVFSVFQADLQRFTGAMELQAGTWKGVVSTLEDSINLLLADTLRPFFETFRDGLKLISQAMSSNEVAKATDTFKASVQSAFGKDSQTQVKALASGMITFAETLLATAEISYRGFHFFRDGISGLVGTALSGISKIYDAGVVLTSWLNQAGKAPGSPFQIFSDKELETVQVRAAMLRSMADEFHRASESSAQAWKGNDTFMRGLRDMSGVLGAARTQLGSTTGAVQDTGAAAQQTSTNVNTLTGSFNAGSEAAAKYLDKIGGIRDDVTGAADMTSAKQWADVLRGVPNLATVAREHLEKMNEDLTKGVDVWRRKWQQAPKEVIAALASVRLALAATQPPLPSSVPGPISGMLGERSFSYGNIGPAASFISDVTKTQNLLKGLTEDGLLPSVDLTRQFGTALLDVGVPIVKTQVRASNLADTLGNLARGADLLGRSLDQSGLSVSRYIDSVSLAMQAGQMMRTGNFGNRLAGGMSAAGALISATGSGSRTSRVFGGAATGAMTTAAMTGAMTATGAKLGSWGGWPGIAVGAGVGAAIGFARSRIVGQDEKEAREAFAQFLKQMGAEFDALASDQQRLVVGSDQWAKMVSRVYDAYLATGRTVEDVHHDLKALTDATHSSAQDVLRVLEHINGVINEQNADMELLDATMAKYGFTLDEIGDKQQARTLTGQAKQLADEYRVLLDAGVDVASIHERMSASVSKFLQDSMRTGTAIPSVMRPLLDNLAKVGLLTDENGLAMDQAAVAGLEFADTWVDGIDRIVVKLDQVLARFAELLGMPAETTAAAQAAIDASVAQPKSRVVMTPFGPMTITEKKHSGGMIERAHGGAYIGSSFGFKASANERDVRLQVGEGVIREPVTSIFGGRRWVDAVNRFDVPAAVSMMTGGVSPRLSDPFADMGRLIDMPNRFMGSAAALPAPAPLTSVGDGGIHIGSVSVVVNGADRSPREVADAVEKAVPGALKRAIHNNTEGTRSLLINKIGKRH